MSDIHLHLHDPSVEAVTAAVRCQQPEEAREIVGVTIIDSPEGQRIELADPLRKLLVGHGWLPPVDGE